MKKIFLMLLLSVGMLVSFSVKAENLSANNGEMLSVSEISSDASKELEKMKRERFKIQKERVARIQASEMYLKSGDKPTLKKHIIVPDDVKTDKDAAKNKVEEPAPAEDSVE